jgi:hypothetical protein
MSKILSSAASVIALSFSFAVVGSDSTLAHEVHHRHRLHAHHGYAGPLPVSHAAPTIGYGMQLVPGRGVVDDSCDLPSSACSNDERIND